LGEKCTKKLNTSLIDSLIIQERELNIFEVGSMVKNIPKKVEDEPLWKKSDKDPDARHKFLWIMLTLIIIIVIAIAVFIVLLPPPKKIVYSDLKLESIQIRRISDEYVDENTTNTDLEVIIYLTNDGLIDSGQLEIDGYIRSFDTRGEETPCNTNDTVQYIPIPVDKTSKITLQFNDLEIRHDERYSIDFLIMEDGKIVEKASTTIKVPFVEVEPEPDVTYSEDADGTASGRSEEKDDDEALTGAPGFEIVPLILSLIVILFLIKNKKRIRK
jgi:hypothetical protein